MFFQSLGLFLLFLLASALQKETKLAYLRAAIPAERVPRVTSQALLATHQPLDTLDDRPPPYTRWTPLPSRARWASEPSMCPRGMFMRVVREWRAADRNTLSKIEFHCLKSSYPDPCPDDTPRWRCESWRESGVESGVTVHPRDCPHPRQFVVGIKVIFGGLYLGASTIKFICDVPHWENTPEGRQGLPKPDREIAQIASTVIDRMDLRWVMGPELVCRDGHAVCGFSTKARTDGSGINEVKAYCCAFPS